MPRLDIVIVNWNSGPLLRRCVASIFAGDLGSVALDRVVVVDNASTDGSAATLEGPSPPLTVIHNPLNRGFAAACNTGAAESTADFLLFLNPDVELERDSLAGAAAFMERNPDVAVSTIRLCDPAGPTQRCCARLPTPGRMIAQSIGLDRLLPRLCKPHFLVDWDHADTRDVPQVMGAFLLVRRHVFERLGGFDERFFLYYEDVDFCCRVAQAGGRLVHNASVSARHLGGGTTRSIKARRQFLAARSRIQYAAKHFGRPGAAAAILAGMALEPAARLIRGTLHGSAEEMRDALKGAAMLWSALLGGLVASTAAAQPRGEGAAGHTPPIPDRPLSVLALTRYPRLGASSRTRFLAYLPALRAAGFEVTVSPFFGEGYLPDLYAGRPRRLKDLMKCYWDRARVLLGARNFDLIWIEKEALPWLPLPVELIFMMGRPYVVDFDDAWFLRYSAHQDFLLRAILGSKLDGLVRRSRLAIVGNEFLDGWARAAGARRSLVLPTAVSLDDYRPNRRQADGPLRIGWIGTPTSATDYLGPLLPVLAEAIVSGWAMLTVIGARSPQLEAIGADLVPWSEEEEVSHLNRFDVGIMPLTEDMWSLGKCAYKLIQYMAVGLPVVASPVGMNRRVVQHGVNGFLATTAEEWLDALRRLAEDPELRRRMGDAGRQMVEGDYSLSVLEPRLADALREAAGPIRQAFPLSSHT